MENLQISSFVWITRPIPISSPNL